MAVPPTAKGILISFEWELFIVAVITPIPPFSAIVLLSNEILLTPGTALASKPLSVMVQFFVPVR